jgi:hypothetical protein
MRLKKLDHRHLFSGFQKELGPLQLFETNIIAPLLATQGDRRILLDWRQKCYFPPPPRTFDSLHSVALLLRPAPSKSSSIGPAEHAASDSAHSGLAPDGCRSCFRIGAFPNRRQARRTVHGEHFARLCLMRPGLPDPSRRRVHARIGQSEMRLQTSSPVPSIPSQGAVGKPIEKLDPDLQKT